MPRKIIDETGKRHGMVEVLRLVSTDPFRGAMFECKCDCGNVCVKSGAELRRNDTHCSCGCARKKPRKPKAHVCVVCGNEEKLIARNMCRRCYIEFIEKRKQAERERYL